MNRLLVFVLSVLPLSLASAPTWDTKGTCGKSKYPDAGDYFLPAPTIVGGIEARPNEFPWMVSLQTKTGQPKCGGSIINEKWILTAAHCLQGLNIKAYKIVAGLHKKNTGASESTVKSYEIEKTIVHENFDYNTIVNDIGLIKIKQEIKFDKNVGTVCAPESKDQYEHVKAVVSGWGTMKSGAPATSVDALRYTTVNTTTNKYCANMYFGSGKITNDMICASDNKGSSERDACQEDSGGPLVRKEKDGTFRLIGIVSWGIGCASKYPGVYARVNYFEEWILKNIKT